MTIVPRLMIDKAARELMGPGKKRWWENYDRCAAAVRMQGALTVDSREAKWAKSARTSWRKGMLEPEQVEALERLNLRKELQSPVRGSSPSSLRRAKVEHLLELRPKIKEGLATPDEIKAARRLENDFRSLYRDGRLARDTASMLGLE